jgi:hypothetical protein
VHIAAVVLIVVSRSPTSLQRFGVPAPTRFSIDDERSFIRTAELSSIAVVDGVLSALADSSSIRIKKRAAVARLWQRLQAEYAALGRQLGRLVPLSAEQATQLRHHGT